MSKKSNMLLFSFASLVIGGSFMIGDRLYKAAGIPVQHKDENGDIFPEFARGRMWVRNNQEKRDIYIDSIDHLKIHAVYIENEKNSHHYMICIHGINNCGEGVGIYAKHFYENGANVLLPDLRGYGQSEGEYIGYGYDDRLDIIEWIYWIIRKDPEAKIALHGISMGAATTLMVTGENLPGNVIAAISDSSYTTAREEFINVYKKGQFSKLPVQLAYPLVRAEIMVRNGYDVNDANPIEAVKHSKTPTLFMHGDSDNFVDTKMCQKLYEAAVCKKEYCLFLGADHVEGIIAEPNKYWKKIDSFLMENGF